MSAISADNMKKAYAKANENNYVSKDISFAKTVEWQTYPIQIQSCVVAEFRGEGKPVPLSPQVIAIYTELKGMIV